MHLTQEQLSTLMSPLWANRVKQRQGFSYLEAFDVKATLIRVFGFGGFSAEVIDSKILDIRDDGRQGTKRGSDEPKTPYVMAQATVRLTIHPQVEGDQPAVYTETAVGTNDGYTIGDVADNAIKSAASDALKRCATYLGTQFGLGLYDNGSLAEVVQVVYGPDQFEDVKAITEARTEAARPRVQGIIDGATTTSTAEENAS